MSSQVNTLPISKFSFQCQYLDCQFNDRSTDSNGSIVSRSWNFGDGNNSTAVNVGHAFATEGTYDVELTVTDNEGASTKSNQTVTVTAQTNVAPVSNFKITCQDLICNIIDLSSDSDGTIVKYVWDFGDDTSQTGNITDHQFSTSGTYNVQLTVTDNYGLTKSKSISVTVSKIVTNVVMSEMHIEDVAIYSSEHPTLGFLLTARAKVVNKNGASLSGVLVQGAFSGAATNNLSATTNASGLATFTRISTKNEGQLKFSINNLVLDGYSYNSADNAESFSTLVLTNKTDNKREEVIEYTTAACGSISISDNDSDDGPSGPLSFFISLFAGLFLIMGFKQPFYKN